MSEDNQFQFWQKEHGFRNVFHPVVKYFVQQRIEFIKNHLALEDMGLYLDVGSGNGISNFYLPKNLKVYALDYSNYYLKENSCPRKIVADSIALPFKENSFDVVCCWEVLHHIPDCIKALLEMKRVSRKYVYIFDPNLYNPAQFIFSLLSKEYRLVFTNSYILDNMVKNFYSAGLKVKIAKTVGWIFPHKTPLSFLPLFKKIPFVLPVTISNFVLGEKIENQDN